MKLLRVTYIALATFISAVSCSKEAAEPDVYDWTDGAIRIRPSIADVTSSRALDMTLDSLESFQVTCFNAGDRQTDGTGFISPYFGNATFIRQSAPGSILTYVSSPAEGPLDWPAGGGTFRFFAFAPSLEVMAANSGISDDESDRYFKLSNRTTADNTGLEIDYRLGAVRVNPDISAQYDFVIAEVTGDRWKDFGGGVELAFRHQMSQIELKAWGASTDYNFEIAGVRIGNPVVEDTFIFSDAVDPDASCAWSGADNTVKDKVEYLYRGATAADDGQSQLLLDKIFAINPTEHNTLESAASIMGLGGCAMVIPTVNPKWEGLADPNIGITPYSTDKMYFSILLRVTDANTDLQLYPYLRDNSGMTVIPYAVDASGSIILRLYPGTAKGEYFTDRERQHPYVAVEGEEIKEFGWAAIPVDADWSAGKRYVYTLNYSEGIGVHDPQDPEPGKPIRGQANISWGVSVGNWSYATANPDYQPDVIVP